MISSGWRIGGSRADLSEGIHRGWAALKAIEFLVADQLAGQVHVKNAPFCLTFRQDQGNGQREQGGMVVLEPLQQIPCPPFLPTAREQTALAQLGEGFQARLERRRPLWSVRICYRVASCGAVGLLGASSFSRSSPLKRNLFAKAV